jgi:hypothetical protein
MSSHSAKSIGRHPDPETFKRECFKVGQITFEIVDHPKNGATFALIAGEALKKSDRKVLFTGVIGAGMGTQLRRLAHHFDEVGG